MKDLVTANHISYIQKHPYYYSVRSYFNLSAADYYFTIIDKYTKLVPHSVMGKFPWTYVHFDSTGRYDAGWKIHISATVENHKEILDIVAKYAFERKIPFKFASNIDHFIYLNSKSIARASSGKYIVVYPEETEFKTVIEELYLLLRRYSGPHILSDRPYKDSKVVFYRYGEIYPISFVDPYGMITTRILSPDNKLEIDNRLPYYAVPKWVESIFPSSQIIPSKLMKKYNVTESVHFSAQGGVYLGEKDGIQYIVKEARNSAGITSDFSSATTRLENEYLALQTLSKFGYTPKPVELLEDNQNLYLVEEHLAGETLHSYPHKHSPYINRYSDLCVQIANEDTFNKEYNNIVYSMLRGISLIHSSGYALGDISPSNIMFNRETQQVKFLDLETAYRFSSENLSPAYRLATPGFVLNDTNHTPEEHDLYKLGLIMLYCIEPYNALFNLDQKKIEHIVHLFQHRTSVPSHILNVILGLSSFKYHHALDAIHDLQELAGGKDSQLLPTPPPMIDISKITYSIQQNLNGFICGNNSLACDPMGFLTNEYCLSFGLLGVLYGMHRADIPLDNSLDKYVHSFMREFYSTSSWTSSLFVGLSGMAYSLLSLGYTNEAKTVLAKAVSVNCEMCDYAYGRAGRLSTCVAFYSLLGDEKYLSCAIDDAEYILAHASEVNKHAVWYDCEGDAYSGLTRGSSGIALALLQLYIVTHNSKYLFEGIKALESDLSRIVTTSSGYIGINSRPINSNPQVYSPYLHCGMAGIGCVLIRYYLITQSPRYYNLILAIMDACRNQMVLFPGYLQGCAGILSFYQDCRYYLHIRDAEPDITVLMDLFKYHYIHNPQYSGFAGNQLLRISHDFHTGSSGVLAVLNRTRQKIIENPFIVADNLFKVNLLHLDAIPLSTLWDYINSTQGGEQNERTDESAEADRKEH